MKRLKRVGCTVLVATSVTNCHIMASTPSGIREFYRGQNGLVVTGKSAPNIEDEYHKTQRATDSNSLDRLLHELGATNMEASNGS